MSVHVMMQSIKMFDKMYLRYKCLHCIASNKILKKHQQQTTQYSLKRLEHQQSTSKDMVVELLDLLECTVNVPEMA